ncbi:DUF6745 domain-containing protein [Rubellicoccus peritrichatus]|uniref:DUF6745 domain-containing protein n=1 Tax=Rubellicoccus peritrichatus TaxID=3080537 RepID=A0AAQ3L5V9_9BACT|nr:hypothetical protein [Puniceicoccus sp. CR14]WOO39357.1 hypothetical protein RZN69_12095 [Puniceicoccus sp. CR14]
MLKFTPEQARDYIRRGGTESLQVSGKLDLSNEKLDEVPHGLQCYELDLSGTSITTLPNDILVECRLILDNCIHLTSLPEGLSVGSISLRNCNSLSALPENLETWFLDLTDCQRFCNWPKAATIHRGHLVLRNCINLQALPPWLNNLANLDVSGCVMLSELPDNFSISSWIDVGGSNIKGLPENLQKASIHWRGVPVDQRIAFQPWDLSASEALKESNAELRRVIIERMGYLRFSQEAKAKIIDEDTDPGGKRQLLRINLEEDEPLVGLSCFCPSTQRQYFLRVPPAMKSCHQAAAWMAGYDDPNLYKPVIET